MPELHEKVKQAAINCGATSLVEEGREGWKKIFPEAKPLRTLYEERI